MKILKMCFFWQSQFNAPHDDDYEWHGSGNGKLDLPQTSELWSWLLLGAAPSYRNPTWFMSQWSTTTASLISSSASSHQSTIISNNVPKYSFPFNVKSLNHLKASCFKWLSIWFMSRDRQLTDIVVIVKRKNSAKVGDQILKHKV